MFRMGAGMALTIMQSQDDEAVAVDRGGYSRSALIRRGWTDGLINQVLGWADVDVANPYYATGSRMRLYGLERVRHAEAKAAFRTLQATRLRRRKFSWSAAHV